MGKNVFLIVSLIALAGCMGGSASESSNYPQTGTSGAPSAVAAQRAVADPSINSVNRTGTIDPDGGTFTAGRNGATATK